MPGGRRGGALSYAAAGVDRGAIGRALGSLLRNIRYRPPASSGRGLSAPGHYAGLIRVGRETIAATTDTVGTKVLLAAEVGAWAQVGEDMVAINVNDLASVGARPFGFLDTISCARPEPKTFAAIGRGVDRGLRAGRVTLLGGETAIVPEIVGGIDLGGTALGFFPSGRRPILGRAIRPGDVVLGLASSGVHANGFTLVRSLLRRGRVALGRPRPGGPGPVGLELLRPTASYVAATEAVADLPGVHGLAHISGGGVRNLARLSRRWGFTLDGWPEPTGLFPWLQSLGPVSDQEMFQTFNMGVGFALVVRASDEETVRNRLRSAGYRGPVRLGTVDRAAGIRLPTWGLRYSGYA